MKFHILTLFPDMVRNGLQTSIIGRAAENNFLEIHAVNIRDFSMDRHGKVDDYTYGGGAGMLLQAQPVYDAWRSVVAPLEQKEGENCLRQRSPRTIYVTPKGHPFTQQYAMELAKEDELIFLCGHYEGIDERVLDEVVTDYISLGDYVLTGGELAAMVMIDAVSRLVPGVLHNEESAQTESFHRNLLEYPQYSRPEVWHDKAVPKVLLSGNHRMIEQWRLEQSVALTKERRPDLYAVYQKQEALIKKLSKNKRQHIHMMESIRSGKGEILFNEGGNVLIYERDSAECMMTVENRREAQQMLLMIPDSAKRLVCSGENVNDILCGQGTFYLLGEYKNACYTQRNPLSVRHKMEGDLAEKATEEILWINSRLQQGAIPWLRIPADNEKLCDLQEKLGLYLSLEPVWLLERADGSGS